MLSQGWLGHGPGATLLIKQLRYIDAMRVLLTDEPVLADEALRIGLVNEVVPHADLLARAEAIAQRIVTLPPVAVRMMKEFVVRFGDLPTDQAWHVQTMMNSMLIQNTMDGEEGRVAFNEKRAPNFDGTLRKRGEPFPELSPEDQARLDELIHLRELSRRGLGQLRGERGTGRRTHAGHEHERADPEDLHVETPILNSPWSGVVPTPRYR